VADSHIAPVDAAETNEAWLTYSMSFQTDSETGPKPKVTHQTTSSFLSNYSVNSLAQSPRILPPNDSVTSHVNEFIQISSQNLGGELRNNTPCRQAAPIETSDTVSVITSSTLRADALPFYPPSAESGMATGQAARSADTTHVSFTGVSPEPNRTRR
jgi:hypothetical protein